GRLWPHLAYVVAKLRVAARIAQSPDLLQQPDRREGGIGEKALADDLLEGIELLGHRSSSFVAGRLAQVAIQLACGDPASNRAAVDPEQFRHGGLAQSYAVPQLEWTPGRGYVEPLRGGGEWGNFA